MRAVTGHGHDHGNPSAMRPVAEHAEAVAALLGPTATETVPLAGALGRILAEDLVSPMALPPFSNSAMDGYAVRSADLADVPAALPVAADIPAGRTDGPALDGGHRAPDHDRRRDAGRRGRGGAGRVDGRRHRDRARSSVRSPPGRTSGSPARTSPRARSCCPRARCSAPPRSGSPRPSAPGRSRCAAGRGCWCSPPAPSSSPRASRCATARSTSRTGRCSPRRSPTRAAVAELLRFVPDDVDAVPRDPRRGPRGPRRRPRRPRPHLGRGQRRGLRGRQGRLHGPGRHVRQGGDAAGHAAGARAPPRSDGRRRGGDAAGQPGQLAGVVRGLRPAGPARRLRAPAARPPARAGPPGRAPGLARPGAASSVADASTPSTGR